jgi:hypothetical protein
MMTTSYACIEGASYWRKGVDRDASCAALRHRGLPLFSRKRTDSNVIARKRRRARIESEHHALQC